MVSVVLESEILENFRHFIKTRGLKYTPEREEILREILSSREHFDVEEIYLRLKEKGQKISKASVYRTIPILIEAGLIQEVYRQGGRSYYEVTLEKRPHLHFICIKCNKVDEVGGEDLLRVINREKEKKNFFPLTYHLEIFGVCRECKEGF